MTIFYIVISVLWGILVFLTTFKEYKWYAIIFGVVSIIVWPIFIVAAIITEIIKLCKSKKNDENISDAVNQDTLINYIKDNISKNE